MEASRTKRTKGKLRSAAQAMRGGAQWLAWPPIFPAPTLVNAIIKSFLCFLFTRWHDGGGLRLSTSSPSASPDEKANSKASKA